VTAASLAYLDLVFCVDLTSSMTPFVAAARTHMERVLDALREMTDLDLRVAIVGYRDHGKIELVETHPFASASAETKQRLHALVLKSPPENSDAAEAVFSGLVACIGLPWRNGAYRIVVLVGDAPPHGCGATASPYPDRFAQDPTGLSLDDMANKLEEAGIFVHSLAMIPSVHPHHDAVLRTAFTRIGIGTGGAFHVASSGDAAMAVVETVSKRCLVHLQLDREIYAALPKSGEPDAEAIAKRVHATPDDVFAGLMRLRQRGLL
jgi:hypothetical protein